MTEITQLEFALLELVKKGKGHWGWYQIESRLSRMVVPRTPSAMSVLKELATRGLVLRFTEEGSPNDRWEITPEGRLLLENLTREKTSVEPSSEAGTVPVSS